MKRDASASRILLAWELGANYGHLLQLAAVAERLRDAGHEILFAVRDLKGAAEILAPRSIPFAQAPFFQNRQRAAAAPVNHAEMLALAGYADEVTASGLARGWIALVRMFRADVVATSYAPGALLAGRVLGLPCAQIGTGFEIPPLVSPLPSIRPWETIPGERLHKAERQVLRRVNRVLRSLGAREFDLLSDWFRTEARILTTFSELDPFGPRPGERYVGGLYEREAGEPAACPEGVLPRVFAYLRADVAGAQNMLKALSAAAARTLCVAPGLSPATIAALGSDRLRIATHPVQLKSALAAADLALVYGGHGVVCAALAAGVPLLVAPHTVEQYLHARRVAAIGAGLLLEKDRSVEAVAARIAQALADGALKAAAQAFAARHASFDLARAIAETADIIGNIANSLPESRSVGGPLTAVPGRT